MLLLSVREGPQTSTGTPVVHASAQQRCRPCRALSSARKTRPYSSSLSSRGAERSAAREREKMDGVGSFGAGRAGSTIDPIAFAKQPQTILRVLSWVRLGLMVPGDFSVVVAARDP